MSHHKDSVHAAVEYALGLVYEEVGERGTVSSYYEERKGLVSVSIQVPGNELFHFKLKYGDNGWEILPERNHFPIKVVRVLSTEFFIFPEERIEKLDVLVWRDGLYTDISGRVLQWSDKGMFCPMSIPFKGRRSLKGIIVLSRQDVGAGLIWMVEDKHRFPVAQSEDGMDHPYYKDPINAGFESFENIPPRPKSPPILDESGKKHKIALNNYGQVFVEVGVDWVPIDYSVVPRKGDEALILIGKEVLGCYVSNVNWPNVSFTTYNGKTVVRSGLYLHRIGDIWYDPEITGFWKG